MYKEVKESFTNTYPTYIIAYCLDTDSFFIINQRHFWWEYYKEFNTEEDAIKYFRDHIKEFKDIRKTFAYECGGISINGKVFLENTKESF